MNNGNKYATGQYWHMQACDGPPDEVDKPQPGVYDHDHDDLFSNVLEQLLPPGAAPVYPTDSSCNARGLSELGEHTVRRMMQKSMVVDPDHLSVRARKGVMSLLEADELLGRRLEPLLEHARREPADLRAGRRDHSLRG